MKNIITLLLIFLSSNSKSFAQENADTIHWKPNYKLKWEDFQGTPDTSFGGAATTSNLFYHSNYNSDTSLVFTVYAVFDKKKSWVRHDSKNDYSLNHEQGHFNITEVYARKLRVAFKNYKVNLNSLPADTHNIFDSIGEELNKMQAFYDKETTYPNINKIKQEQWDKKIAAWLKEDASN